LILAPLWTKLRMMQTIQIAVDEPLLRAADSAARRKKIDRSALVRQALREHLKRLGQKDNERRDRLGYKQHPEADDLSAWEAVAAGPVQLHCSR
jgi:hypothetical protein